MRSYNPIIKGHSGQISKAIDLLINAKKPMVYSGGGVVLGNASEILTKLVKKLDFPITSTLMGLGGFPASEKNFLGMLGMHGTYQANMAMQDCDVLFAIGARFDDRVIGNPDHFLAKSKKIIHIDIDPASISKRVQIDIPIVGDVNLILNDFLNAYKKVEKSHNKKLIEPWRNEIQKWINTDCLAYNDDGSVIKPQLVIQKLHEVTKGDAFITSDVGQHQMWAAQYYPFNKPRKWINSGGLGTMGVGLPYAMGCQLAFPNSQVACVTGEASIQMCIQELSTCKQFNLPVKIINLNNRYMGMVRQWQEFFYGNRYAESYMDALPDFVKLAESYGHVGFKIENSSDVEGALKEAFSPKLKERLVFIDFITDQSENVFPMIPNGKGLSEMILAEDL
jgi:acetolactate synthase-1/2/3 large subunit